MTPFDAASSSTHQDDFAFALMRHGAYTASTGQLTDKGKCDVDAVAQKLIDAGFGGGIILHSPAPRTTETAQRLKDAFEKAGCGQVAVIADNDLGEGFSDTLKQAFKKAGDASRIVVVTHEPNIIGLAGDTGEMIFSTPTANAHIFQGQRGDLQAARFTRTVTP